MNKKINNQPPSLRRPEPLPCLVFAPLAWLKLQFFLHAGDTEIGGFGVSDPANLLHITDFVTIRQKVSAMTVEFDDAAVADYFDQMVDQGLEPQHFARVWIHTHPGSSAQPSGTDEQTLERVFGRCDWSIMFIIARSGEMYARLQFNTGPQAAVLLPVRVDWEAWPQLAVEQAGELGRLIERWAEEYIQNVQLAASTDLANYMTEDRPSISPTRLSESQEPGWELEDWRAIEAAELLHDQNRWPQRAWEGR